MNIGMVSDVGVELVKESVSGSGMSANISQGGIEGGLTHGITCDL